MLVIVFVVVIVVELILLLLLALVLCFTRRITKKKTVSSMLMQLLGASNSRPRKWKPSTNAVVDSEHSKSPNPATTTASSSQNEKAMKRHLILFSNNKSYYKYYNEVELSASGMGSNKMEAVDSEHRKSTDAAAAAATATDSLSLIKEDSKHRKKRNNVILVSNTMKPFGFCLDLAKSYLEHSNEAELSALAAGTPTVVTIAKILTVNGFANIKQARISAMHFKEDNESRLIPKREIQIVPGRANKLNNDTEQDAEKA